MTELQASRNVFWEPIIGRCKLALGGLDVSAWRRSWRTSSFGCTKPRKKIIVMNYKISGQKFICCNNV
jgi:hypothetical protein